MSIKINIPLTAIRAVCRAMAVSDVRYYLNGLNIETNEQTTRVTATDGHRLHSYIHQVKENPKVNPVTLIIPDTAIKALLASKASPKMKKSFQTTITAFDNSSNIELTAPDGNIITTKPIDGKFPDWTRLVPEKVSGEYMFINPDYVIDARDAFRDLGYFVPAPALNGVGPAVLQHENFLAIIMPTREASSECDTKAFRAPIE